MSEDLAAITAIADTQGIQVAPLLGGIEQNEIFYPDVVETVFQNVLRHTITGNNNITTHYVENGINYEDVTTTDPLTVTIEGWMAELFYHTAPIFRRVMELVVQTSHIPLVGGFISTELSSIAYILSFVYDRLRTAVDIFQKYALANWSEESGYDDTLIEFDESKRLGYQLAVLEGLRQRRLPINMTIPRVGTFYNMLLKNYEWDQDKSYYQAKITLTFRQARNTSTLLAEIKNDIVATREAEPNVIQSSEDEIVLRGKHE